jgi:hypothetical protein
VKALNYQALKAYNNLFSISGSVKIDIITQLSLFDSLDAPIIMYGSEVWGTYDYIDTFSCLNPRYFYKIVLGVRS